VERREISIDQGLVSPAEREICWGGWLRGGSGLRVSGRKNEPRYEMAIAFPIFMKNPIR